MQIIREAGKAGENPHALQSLFVKGRAHSCSLVFVFDSFAFLEKKQESTKMADLLSKEEMVRKYTNDGSNLLKYFFHLDIISCISVNKNKY